MMAGLSLMVILLLGCAFFGARLAAYGRLRPCGWPLAGGRWGNWLGGDGAYWGDLVGGLTRSRTGGGSGGLPVSFSCHLL